MAIFKKICWGVLILSLFALAGCGDEEIYTNTSNHQEAQKELVKIVDYNLSGYAGQGAVLVKNISDKNIKDISVKVTAIDAKGNVIGIVDGSTGFGDFDPQLAAVMGITNPIIAPGDQIGISLLFTDASQFPNNANLEWVAKAKTTNYLSPDANLVSVNMVIDEYGWPTIFGKIRNDSSQEATIGIVVDLFKDNQFITSKSLGSNKVFLET